VKDEFITIREAVQICNASERRLREAIAKGEISVHLMWEKNPRKGSHRPCKHISVHELEEWLMKTGGTRGPGTGARTA
jgi:hypothetical protein